MKNINLWSRRQFLASLVGVGAFAHASGEMETDSFLFHEQQKRGFSILQGLTDETTAQFSIVVPKNTQWMIEILDSTATPLGTLRVQSFERPFSDFAVYKVFAEGLRLGEAYKLRVLDPMKNVRDEREFRALDLSPRSVRLAFASCMCDHLHRDDVWAAFANQRPEMAFFIGDSVYGDRPGFFTVKKPDPAQLWNRYVATRNRVAFYFQQQLIPVLAIWDDHDFGGNNVCRSYPYKEDSKLIFETFFAQEERASTLLGPGISRRFSAFGADFMLMDGRTFRDAWGDPDPRMFGSSQEKWFFSAIQAKPTWILNGSVFYGAYTGKDSYEGQYSGDFKTFISKLKETEGLFCFGSGDVHFSEIMDVEAAQLGYKTFEMVSSSMHSYTFPGHHHRWYNPRRRVSTSAHNFTVFEGEFTAAGIDGVITSYSSSSQEFRTPVRVTR